MGQTTPYKNSLRTGVNADGVLAEYVLQRENTLVHSPKTISDVQAAKLSCMGLTAWKHLMLADAKAGQTILVQGTDVVSLFALQIAKVMGLKIIATPVREEKEAKLKELGAHEVINYKKVGSLSEKVKRLNNGTGVDLTLEVGGKRPLNRAFFPLKKTDMLVGGFFNGKKFNLRCYAIVNELYSPAWFRREQFTGFGRICKSD